ncbi:uncharacterized protein PG998_008102 [Apiospora kogelbergensis]|uniref:uncharacterized protein n=1 Tax=Apiospora kogelbergensis TaxID=1337665 RepID=UPI0031302950
MSRTNHLACGPVALAAALAPQDVDYAYIESNGDPANMTTMAACCAPQPAQQDGSCYTWCQVPAEAGIDVPETRLSWEWNFQYCLNHQGRLASGEGGRFKAPKVHTVQGREKEVNSGSSWHLQLGTVKGVVFLTLVVLSFAFM